MPKLEPEKLLQKGRFKIAYDKLDEPELRRKVVSEYAKLLEENDSSDKMLWEHLWTSILPAVAFNRILTENGWGKDKVFGMIHDSAAEVAKASGKSFQAMGKLPFFFSLLRIACPAMVKKKYGPSGWDFTWKRNDKDAIEWDCGKCFYDVILRKYGMPELVQIFCETDDFVYGSIPGVRWGRTKTIGRGDSVCDFCFYREDKSS
ncbi:MAG: L-2-amino-thiazoline-4-carboxylic acid hydrolase [Clostridiales bacterium]|jgi:hypothetical protein|nr:L-2-amino-thiazoline-4-carboxylic acid hydrolase [Clostridiales bacterium]MDR2749424.1 L-2-amino-thiazoline-4-carboxylic acid hydrolase [Clostridiales bacterium]